MDIPAGDISLMQIERKRERKNPFVGFMKHFDSLGILKGFSESGRKKMVVLTLPGAGGNVDLFKVMAFWSFLKCQERNCIRR